MATALWVFDFDLNRVTWANRAGLDVWRAKSIEELSARDLAADMSETVRLRLCQYKADFAKRDVTFSELWTLYPNGVPTTLNVLFRRIDLPDGRIAMLCEGTVNHDALPETLRSTEALLHTPVMISLFSENGENLYQNPASRASQVDCKSTFIDRFYDLRTAQKLIRCLKKRGHCREVTRVRTQNGIRWHEITARACHDSVTGEPAYLVSEIDVTELKETEERARYFADHDSLTGLPNRHYLGKALPRILRRAAKAGRKVAFYFIDLDGFKRINDTLGHESGDLLLATEARLLREFVGNKGIVARLGGDEFLVCIADIGDEAAARRYGRALFDACHQPVDVGGHVQRVSLSIGMSRFPDDGRDLDTLMRHADLALYEAKARRSRACVPFSMELRDRLEKKVALEADLKRALENGDLVLYYQPRICLKSGRFVAAEALLRWQHPERGLILPGEFISLAEESGLINRIGEWVATSAARAQAELRAEGIDITISVNLSAQQFAKPDFVQKILDLPAETGCAPENIAFEITESLLLGDDAEVLDALRRFKQKGFELVIDDFGTGYSNLAYLQKYPLSVLKIDRTFIQNIEKSAPIVGLIISLCKVLDLKIVAEGVETEAQLKWLGERGCHEYQGFLFSRPVPLADMKRLYRRTAALAGVEPTGAQEAPVPANGEGMRKSTAA